MGIRGFRLSSFSLLFVLCVFIFQANAQSDQLTGIYQIDVSKSTNIHSIVENVAQQNKLLSPQKTDLQAKLTPTELVSIAINGSQVTLASNISGPTTLSATNKFQTVNASGGSSVNIRTTLIGNSLMVSSIYDSTNFSITFRSINSGKNLRVTRTVKTNYLQQTVFADSFYTKVNSSTTIAGNFNNFSDDTYIVPNGTVLAGNLENYISTKDSQVNDKFRLIVQSPSQYQGAIIEGYISGIERAKAISGTPKMTLNFQNIKLANGKTYKFAGIIENISQADESKVKSTDESQLKGQNRTKESVKRGIITAGVGAIIGAAIGGKKGAVVGAAAGGVGGPVTLLLEGSNDLTLKQGSQINVQSTSPN